MSSYGDDYAIGATLALIVSGIIWLADKVRNRWDRFWNNWRSK